VTQRRPPHYRLIDRYVVHPGRAPLTGRVADVIPEDADYVVLDLDRTVHLGVTIGERLGWEILGDPACDPDRAPDAERPDAFFSARKPLRSTIGLARGVRHWGLAGLFYAATVRLGDRWSAWDRFLSTSLGSEYVNEVQSVLRSVLMASAADYTREQLDAYADRAWVRYQRRLVVDADVVAAVRRRCPRLKAIILSSASTAPTVGHAARKLGVDGFVSSAVDTYTVAEGEVFSAPVGIPAWLRPRRPRFFSRPGAVVHNSSSNKVNFLRMHYPEVFDADAVSVGISDNNYGEDRAWPDHFDHVIGLNTRHPFSPFVRAASPCKSLQVIDAAPTAAADLDERAYGWVGTLQPSELCNGELIGRFADGAQARLESLRDSLRHARERAAAGADQTLRRRLVAAVGELADAVDLYNRASDDQRVGRARDVHKLATRMRRVRSELDRVGRDCARIQHEVELVHERAARSLAARTA